MWSVFSVSFFAVFKLLLIVVVGCILGKTKIMTADARRSLSKIILWAMLPSMLIYTLCQNISVSNISQYAWVAGSAGIVALFGFILGEISVILFKVPKEQRRPCIAATSLGNASYIPLPLLATICAMAPLFSKDPRTAQTLAITYVSVYLMCHSPLLWLVGFPYLSGKAWRDIRLGQILSPPICASLIGWLIGLTPLRQLFVGVGAPLGVVLSTMKMLSDGVFPCALLVMGGILADPPPQEERIHWNTVSALALGKLLLMPMAGFALAAVLWKTGLIPRDGVCALVIMVEAAVPPANNLIIMCQSMEKGESSMARLLIAAYSLAVPTLTLWIMFFLKQIGTWME